MWEFTQKQGTSPRFNWWGYRENYNIAPSAILTITEVPEWRKWSYSPSWAKEPMNLINARSETVREKPSFKESNPCLVLADGWYEWKRDGETKQPYFFHMGHQMFYIAGIYNETGCALLTKEANEKLSPIHHWYYHSQTQWS